ncbi:MAG: MATE family efflux transporter, partial [Clostridiales bacterium]
GTNACVAITIILSVIMSTALILWGDVMISIFNKEPEVIATGYDMLRTVGPFYVFMGLLQCYTNVIRGAGAATVAM